MACVLTLDHVTTGPPWLPGQMCVSLISQIASDSELVAAGDACGEQDKCTCCIQKTISYTLSVAGGYILLLYFICG